MWELIVLLFLKRWDSWPVCLSLSTIQRLLMFVLLQQRLLVVLKRRIWRNKPHPYCLAGLPHSEDFLGPGEAGTILGLCRGQRAAFWFEMAPAEDLRSLRVLEPSWNTFWILQTWLKITAARGILAYLCAWCLPLTVLGNHSILTQDFWPPNATAVPQTVPVSYFRFLETVKASNGEKKPIPELSTLWVLVELNSPDC